MNRSRLPLLVLLLGVFGACGGGADSTEPQERLARASLLPPEFALDAWGGGTFAVWLDAPSVLTVRTRGAGVGSVFLEEEDGREAEIFSLEGDDSDRVRLDGPFPRAVRLAFSTTGEARFEAIELERVEAEDPGAPDPAPDLRGAFAGRDVIVLLTDALHAAHLSCYGNERPTSPAIDRLAADGVRFEEAYSQASWTVPSVATLFTSLEQERHGMVFVNQELNDGLTTLAELFHGAGYRTVGLVQNGIIWPHTGLDRGFDRYETFKWRHAETERLLAQARAEVLAERDEPLFLYFHLAPPHAPYVPPERYRNRFDRDYDGEVDGSLKAIVHAQEKDPNHPDVQHLVALYQEHLTYADATIAQLLGAITDAGREEEILVLHTSDHGEAFLEHGLIGHGPSVYEEMIRIPLIVSAPGSALPRGRVVHTPVTLLDVLPTLAELCDLGTTEQPIRGRSFADLLASEDPGRKEPLYFSSRYTKGATDPEHLALRAGDYKLYWVRKSGEVALYDLAEDPGETTDLSDERPILTAALHGRLRREYENAQREGEVRRRGRSVEIDEETRAELEKLGYLEAE